MSERLKILIVNDDGIKAEGIKRLAKAACELGDVWVVAPESQCSGMSQKLTIFEKLRVKKVRFPVKVKAAWSVSGTPTDCVKIGLMLLGFKPDYVFSGINYGVNAGFDVAYSGTMGAAFEAELNGIRAIAFSREDKGSYEIAEKYLLQIARELVAAGQEPGEVWNVNFPSCPPAEFMGILRERKIAQNSLYEEGYSLEKKFLRTSEYKPISRIVGVDEVEEDTDIHAILTQHISIGKVKTAVIS